ncbi:NADH-quinone oxidoreductase subunit A [Enterobacter hormaechei]
MTSSYFRVLDLILIVGLVYAWRKGALEWS